MGTPEARLQREWRPAPYRLCKGLLERLRHPASCCQPHCRFALFYDAEQTPLAAFSVNASGSATLAYQWYFDGGAIAGATSSSLDLPGVQDAAAGSYYVKATNGAGSATSHTVKLTVVP